MKQKNMIVVLFLSLFLGGYVFSLPVQAASDEQTLLATTFPIYQIVRNVAQGRQGVRVELMLPSQMGCPHDYMLTPQDMKKLARADILVVNGLGMEEFLGAPVRKANPQIEVVDSSVGITDLIQYAQESCCHEHHHHDEHPFEWAGAYPLDPGVYHWSFATVAGQYADPAMKMAYVQTDARDPIEACEHEASELFAQDGQPLQQGGRLRPGQLHLLQFDKSRDTTQFTVKIDKAGTYAFFTEHQPEELAAEHGFTTADGQTLKPVAQESESGHHHHHSGTNPHLFASPRMAARLALNIAAGLAQADPQGAAVYQENAQSYAQTLNQLADDMAALGQRLPNNRIVEPHGIFDYLARDMGLEIVAVTQAHGQEPSAAEMVQLVKTIRDQDAGAIFTEPQYSDKVGRALAQETGIPVARLDPVATGPQRTPLNYYETVMRQNMQTFKATLGGK